MSKAVSQSFFVGDTLREAWKILRENLVEVVAIYVVGAVVPQIIFFVIRQSMGDEVNALFVIVNQIVSIIVSMGLVKAFLDVVQNRKIDISFLWKEPKRVLDFVGGMILYMVIVIGGFLLLIVPGVIWSIKFRFFSYLIIEKGLGPIAALKESARITDGVKWDILAFDMALFVIVLLGFLALLVGLIVAIPLVALAQIVFFLRLVEHAKK